jgi:hypothetical protein
LELFFKNVPEDCGMAFVIVQHLDPTHKGIMAELLQRATLMRVVQVKDRTRVQPDCVYVIPPNKDMSLLHGVLHLLEPVSPRGLRLPIDFFFRSLAEGLITGLHTALQASRQRRRPGSHRTGERLEAAVGRNRKDAAVLHASPYTTESPNSSANLWDAPLLVCQPFPRLNSSSVFDIVCKSEQALTR